MPGINPPTPYNWNVGDVASSSLLNAQLYNLSTFFQNPPYFFGYQANAQTIASSPGTFVPVNLDTEVADTEGGHSNTTNNTRYTCQIAGLYHVEGVVCFNSTNTTGFRSAKFVVNSGTNGVLGGERLVAPATFQPTVSTSIEVRMAVGDYIELHCLQNSGASINLASNSPSFDYVTHMRLWWMTA